MKLAAVSGVDPIYWCKPGLSSSKSCPNWVRWSILSSTKCVVCVLPVDDNDPNKLQNSLVSVRTTDPQIRIFSYFSVLGQWTYFSDGFYQKGEDRCTLLVKILLTSERLLHLLNLAERPLSGFTR